MDKQITNIISDDAFKQLDKLEYKLSKCLEMCKQLHEKYGIKIEGVEDVPNIIEGLSQQIEAKNIVGESGD